MSNEIPSRYEEISQKEADLLTKLSLSEFSKQIMVENFGAFSEAILQNPKRLNEFLMRKSMYDELEEIKGSISFNSYIEKENIVHVQKMLLKTDVNLYTVHEQLTTKIEGYHDDGDFNYHWTGSEKVSYVEYISRLTKKPGFVKETYGVLKVEDNFKNAKIFLDRLIYKKPSIYMEYKNEINQIYSDLGKGERDALTQIQKLTASVLGGYKVNMDSNLGLAKGLRQIQDNLFSGEILYNELKDITSKTTKNKQEEIFTQRYAHYSGTVELQGQYQTLIQKRYDEVMNFLKSYDVLKYQSILQDESEQGKIKEGIIGVLAFDKTIADVGVQGLGEAAQIYNEMKGLNGFLNFSDENKELTKETILFLLGMLVTSGTGVVLSIALKSHKGLKLFEGFRKVSKKVDLDKVFSGSPNVMKQNMREYFKVVNPENKGDINKVIQAELDIATERDIIEMSKGMGKYLQERGLLNISIQKSKIPEKIPQIEIPKTHASLSQIKEFITQNYKKTGIVIVSVGSISYLVNYVSQNEISFAPIIEQVAPVEKKENILPAVDDKKTPSPKENIPSLPKGIIGPSIQHDRPKMSKKDLKALEGPTENENDIIHDAISYTRRKYNLNQIKLLQLALGLKETGKLTPYLIGKIIDFQSKKGLTPDGKIGPKTLAKMPEINGYGYQIAKKSNGTGEIVGLEVSPVKEKGKEPQIERPHIPPNIEPPREIEPSDSQLIAKIQD